jgi:uncharacterized protein
MLTNILIGFGIGLAGSFHCIGMCGPLALSLPLHTASRTKRFFLITLYNLGRAGTYFLLGVLFGLLGNTFFLVGYQQVLSITIGILILFILLFGNILASRVLLFSRFYSHIKQMLARLLNSEKTTFSYFVIGLVNGLLPCGLVYLAIASAVATGSPLGGGLLMLAFGLGTIPLMFALMVAGRYVSLAVRQNMRKLVPVFVGLMACLMILRGLNLGIPYISPAFSKNDKGNAVQCHTPLDSTHITGNTK